MKQYTVVQVGLGSRGIIHIDGMIHNSDMFKVIGYCNRSMENLLAAKEHYQLSDDVLFTNAEEALKACQPDILSFATMPHDRIDLIKLAAKYHVKGIMFEKPISTSLAEAKEILDICNEANVKTILCHQHKYLRSFMKLKEFLDSGELGKIYQIQVQCQQHANQIATHYIDYMIWANRGVKPVSVVGHTHGTFYLANSHPSPDYILGEVAFENGVRGIVECGYYAPQHLEHDNSFDHGPKANEFYTDDRLTVYGETGYAWAECNGRWAAFTSKTGGKVVSGDFGGFFEQEQFTAQDRYTYDFGLWLEDDSKVHPSNLEAAYQGYQILEGIYISALENRRVDFPLEVPLPYDCLEKLTEVLPDVDYKKLPE